MMVKLVEFLECISSNANNLLVRAMKEGTEVVGVRITSYVLQHCTRIQAAFELLKSNDGSEEREIAVACPVILFVRGGGALRPVG